MKELSFSIPFPIVFNLHRLVLVWKSKVEVAIRFQCQTDGDWRPDARPARPDERAEVRVGRIRRLVSRRLS